MGQSRGLAVIGVLTTALLALVASFMLADDKNSASILYCLSDPTTSSITTLDSSLPNAQCFRVQDGKFTATFDYVPNTNTEEVRYLGGYVLPGIIESHGHILQYG